MSLITISIGIAVLSYDLYPSPLESADDFSVTVQKGTPGQFQDLVIRVLSTSDDLKKVKFTLSAPPVPSKDFEGTVGEEFTYNGRDQQRYRIKITKIRKKDIVTFSIKV